MPVIDNPELSVLRCYRCKQTKPREEFHKKCYACKPCKSLISAESYKNNWFKYTSRLKKSYCKKHGIDYDLTPEYLESIYTDTCPVFGTVFVRNDKTNSSSPTLDRINPDKGYVQGNVCYISHRANRIKYDATVTELKQILEWYESATTNCTPK